MDTILKAEGIKMYYIGSWGFTIKEVEVTRKSDSSIWYMYGGHERRESSTYYFDTWEQAKQAIVDRETNDLRNAERQLERAKEELEKALAITRA